MEIPTFDLVDNEACLQSAQLDVVEFSCDFVRCGDSSSGHCVYVRLLVIIVECWPNGEVLPSPTVVRS